MVAWKKATLPYSYFPLHNIWYNRHIICKIYTERDRDFCYSRFGVTFWEGKTRLYQYILTLRNFGGRRQRRGSVLAENSLQKYCWDLFSGHSRSKNGSFRQKKPPKIHFQTKIVYKIFDDHPAIERGGGGLAKLSKGAFCVLTPQPPPPPLRMYACIVVLVESNTSLQYTGVYAPDRMSLLVTYIHTRFFSKLIVCITMLGSAHHNRYNDVDKWKFFF